MNIERVDIKRAELHGIVEEVMKEWKYGNKNSPIEQNLLLKSWKNNCIFLQVSKEWWKENKNPNIVDVNSWELKEQE